MAPASFEKSVKGATKAKNAAPKSKYIEHILTATNSDAGVAEIFRTLQNRLRDSTWTIVFKSLIVIHMMIREGTPGAALGYLAQHPRRIAITSISEVQVQGSNIWRYSAYLTARSVAFAETKTDYVRNGQGRLKRLTVAKGLLRETEVVQRQIETLLKCDLLTDELENEITLTSFRLLTLDLLTLFSVMNEGTINVLEHYFEMSRPDSERALKIYKTFSALTDDVVKFLRVARQFEGATRLEIPNLKHASTDLARLLEDDLNDPDFDIRRREYRAQKEAKKNPKSMENAPTASKPSSEKKTPSSGAAPAPPKLDIKTPAPDLIDFFESIEQNQQPMAQQPPPQQFTIQGPQFQQFQQTSFQPQQTSFIPQQTSFQQVPQEGFGQPQPSFVAQFGLPNSNPFGQPQPQQTLQPDHTGAGFGGYTPQSQPHGFQSTLSAIPQDGVASFQQQQQVQTGQQRPSNPFRQSMLPPENNPSPQSAFGSPTTTISLTRQHTNPFAKHVSPQGQQFSGGGTSQFPSPAPQPLLQQQPIQSQRTGTNPFARNPPTTTQTLQPPTAAPLRPNVTGSTNPFRQSALVNMSGQQGTIGGLETLETVPVFPRPGQPA